MKDTVFAVLVTRVRRLPNFCAHFRPPRGHWCCCCCKSSSIFWSFTSQVVIYGLVFSFFLRNVQEFLKVYSLFLYLGNSVALKALSSVHFDLIWTLAIWQISRARLSQCNSRPWALVHDYRASTVYLPFKQCSKNSNPDFPAETLFAKSSYCSLTRSTSLVNTMPFSASPPSITPFFFYTYFFLGLLSFYECPSVEQYNRIIPINSIYENNSLALKITRYFSVAYWVWKSKIAFLVPIIGYNTEALT